MGLSLSPTALQSVPYPHIRTVRCVSTVVSGSGRDYAMCKIQTRVAPEAQLRISKKMYFLISEGIGVVDRWQESRLA
jgi:hypothetical protein